MKGVLIDFGGTIDTDGSHWYKVFKRAYNSVMPGLDDALLRNAYIHAERTLGRTPVIKPEYTFLKTLECKIALQAEYLSDNGCDISNMQRNLLLDGCYSIVQDNICNVSRPELLAISESLPMVLVTNFYGNMRSVLKEFDLDSLFYDVVESAVVGVRKPDAAIYNIALEHLALPATDVVMIGDTISKDMEPAIQVGCQTIWIKGEQWEDESITPSCTPNITITTLKGLSELL